MAKEIWLWIKEQFSALFSAIGRMFTALWRWFRGWLSTISGSTWRKVVLAVPLLFFAYILLGMAFLYRIDDSLETTPRAPAGASQVVADISYLMKREVIEHRWMPNDPFFTPGWWLDNTPNYQRGMLEAISRFSFELRDQLGRTRGSSTVDKSLEAAASSLSMDPDLWVMDFSSSFLPTRPAETHYRDAIKALDDYNARLARSEALFERRSDNLLATIDRIALDLGASSAALEKYIGEESGGILLDFGSDDLFYRVKGQVYAYVVILEALRVDFADVIKARQLGPLYDELLVSMTAAAKLDPLMVSNGAVDGLTANHLSMQGFYLLRARTQLREVSNILLK